MNCLLRDIFLRSLLRVLLSVSVSLRRMFKELNLSVSIIKFVIFWISSSYRSYPIKLRPNGFEYSVFLDGFEILSGSKPLKNN